MKVLENSPAGRQLKHIVVQISDGTSEPIPSAAVIRASDNNVTSPCSTSCPTQLKVSWATQNLYSKYRTYRIISLQQNLKSSTNFSDDKRANKIIQTEGRELYSNSYNTWISLKKMLPIRIKIK